MILRDKIIGICKCFDLSAAATAIITILYLLALLGKGTMYAISIPGDAISIPGRVRRKLYKPTFIVLPTPEEAAIYCVENDNALFGSEAEWLEERRGGGTRLSPHRPSPAPPSAGLSTSVARHGSTRAGIASGDG